MEKEDRLKMAMAISGVVSGWNNKKRKRVEVDGLDEDDNEKRKQRMIEERMKQLKEQNYDDIDEQIELLNNLTKKQSTVIDDEDEMSEEEVQRIKEQQEYFKV